MSRTLLQLHIAKIVSPSLIGFLLLLTLPASHVQAIAGDLDPGFGSGGRVISNFSSFAIALDVAIQDDNKILAAGLGNSGSGIDFTLARYNADGSLDANFGSGGVVTTDLNNNDAAHGIAIQSDGKIILAGLGGPSSADFCLARYNTNGALDLGFGSGGKVVTDFFGNFDFAKSVVLQPDGKIIAAGQSSRVGTIVFALARYNTDGSLDTSFGTGGKVDTDFFGVVNVINSLALQPDGKIVAGGTAVDSSTLPSTTNFALARYNADGSLDSGFGAGGRVTTHGFSFAQFCNGVVIQPDGKIVAAGGAVNANGEDFALVRFKQNGVVDTSFGVSGLVSTDFLHEDDYITGVVLQSNGKILVAGTARDGLTGDNFAVARYDQNGSLDPSFGSGGKTTTDFTGANDTGRAIALQSDGRIVVAGDAAFQSFALARCIGDAPQPPFDLCLQDESNGNLLQINTATGNHRFSNCVGLTLEGTGILTIRGGSITLRHNASDRRVLVRADTASGKGTATFQFLSQGTTFSIIDRNIANNICACR